MGTDALARLHQTLIDTRAGYAKAAEEAEEPSLRELLRDMVATRDAAHEEVHRLLSARGAPPDDKGSVMSVVHKTVIGARSAIVGLDASALNAFVSGEDHVLAAYDAAINEGAGDPASADILAKQRAILLDKIAAMKAMANSQN